MHANLKWLILLLFLLMPMLAGGLKAQKFYEADEPAQAQLKVFFEMEMANADLRVHIVYDEKDITSACLWMEVSNKANADILIIFVDEPNEAHMTINLVDNKEQRGFRNDDIRKKFIELTGYKKFM